VTKYEIVTLTLAIFGAVSGVIIFRAWVKRKWDQIAFAVFCNELRQKFVELEGKFEDRPVFEPAVIYNVRVWKLKGFDEAFFCPVCYAEGKPSFLQVTSSSNVMEIVCSRRRACGFNFRM